MFTNVILFNFERLNPENYDFVYIITSTVQKGLSLSDGKGKIMDVPKTIKTACGFTKFENLNKKKSVLGRARLYWFVLFASIRDFFKSRTRGN